MAASRDGKNKRPVNSSPEKCVKLLHGHMASLRVQFVPALKKKELAVKK
ncbi:unnamed protein product, partial [Ectocarpus sp. 8 AP-2014]